MRTLANLDTDDVSPELYQEIIMVIARSFREFAISTLRKDISEDDISLCRVKKQRKRSV